MKGLVVGVDPTDHQVLEQQLQDCNLELIAVEDLARARSELGTGEQNVLILGTSLSAAQARELSRLVEDLPPELRPWTLRLVDGADPDGLREALEDFADAHALAPVTERHLQALLQRARREKRTHDEDALVQRIAEASPSIIYLYDLHTHTLIYVNRNMEMVLGYTFEQVRAMGRDAIPHLVHPDDLARGIGDLSRLTGADEGVVTEFRLRTADGQWRWMRSSFATFVHERGVPVQIVGTIEDIHDRKQAETAVARAHNDFREVIENIPDFVLLYRGGEIVYVNATAVEFFGFGSREEVMGHSVLDFVHPDDREIARARVQTSERRSQPLGPLELRIIRQGGEAVWVEVVGGRIIEFDGQPTSLVVIRDISQRKRIQSRLMLADRMVSVGTLAAGVAHEINNPLSYVIGNLAYMSEQLTRLVDHIPESRRDDLLEAVREAREGAERVRVIVSDLRTFSREDDSTTRSVDIHTVLDSTLNIAANHLRSRAKVDKDFQPVPYVRGNPARLGQVFLNLLVNSAQAIPEGEKEENEVSLRSYLDGNKVIVEVSDTGSGIPQEILDRVFDPFFTTKAVGVGTGLGLSICHNIVESLGGQMTVESELGVGTTFRVELPMDEQATVPRPAPPQAEPTVSPRSRVLVLDDDPIVGRAIERALAEQHDVVVTSEAQQALHLCKTEEFDVVFCDVLMPGMSGMEFYQRLSEVRPEMQQRVVFITAGTSNEQIRAFFDSIDNENVTKPFDIEKLRAIARAHAERTADSPPADAEPSPEP